MTTSISTPAHNRVLTLNDAHDPLICGNKAAALGALRRAGHHVPDGVVVPAGVAFTRAEAMKVRDHLGQGPWAVRSSSVAEDLVDASFAGQYETVLNVTTLEGLVDAVALVRVSASTAHAADYQRAQAYDAMASMAVLVQRQVGARAAGVAFSANPITGADEVIIEAVPGLGDRLASVAERVHPIREENVLYTQSLPVGLVRRTLLELGRRLVARCVLRRADEVAYLEVEEIGPALEGHLVGEPAAARAARRHAEHRWVRANPGPAFHGPAPVPPPSTRGLPAAMQRLLGAFTWHITLEETSEPPAVPHGALAGVGASTGRVSGRVRVIRHEAELSSLEPGEILVCASTHSSWSVAFARAAALVTDHGGMLAHPAIVAREYGIPAVVGTGVATSSLVDGQTVTVDGATGRVEMS